MMRQYSFAMIFFLVCPILQAQNGSHGSMNDPKPFDLGKLHCDIESSFTTIDAWPTGVAWDGNFLWSGGSRGNYIYKYSLTGVALDSIRNPSTKNGTEGLVCEGNILWAMVEEEDLIFKIDMNSGRVLDQFKFDLSTDGFGLAIEGDYLLAADYEKGTIVKIDRANGKVDGAIQLSKPVLGICMIDHTLFGIDDDYKYLYEIDMKSGKFVDSLSWCVPYALGLAWDGTSLWNVSSNKEYGGDQKIYRMKIDIKGRTKDVLLPVPVFLQVNVDSTNTILKVEHGHTLINCRYLILNSSGNQVESGNLSDAENQLDISKYSNGIYTFQAGEFVRTFEIHRN